MKRKAPDRKKSKPRKEIPFPAPRKNDFLIAAVGASAGGIEAFIELVKNLPPDSGMAFVLIQHLDPTHHSLLSELISRQTSMGVTEVTDGMVVEPNHAYVIPPNASMSISDHTLHIGPRQESRGAHMPIDHFMRSLAEAHGDRAIGVILSGTGTDGTLGMVEIRAHGGWTFAQSEDSAGHSGMPHSAIAVGGVDAVLPPKGIARELARISQHPYLVPGSSDGHEGSGITAMADPASMDTIFHQLRRVTGVDFTHYRKTTILRRIQRRMVVHKMEKLRDYVKHLHSNSTEIKALYQDLLINVTSFFRNPALFDVLKAKIFRNIFKQRAIESALRIWVPGCASGEETYSIAISLLEYLGDDASRIPIQFFGTDVSETSVAKARSGVYTKNIEGDVASERLRRFFTKVEGGYAISKNIRDMCIFAQHNVVDDPPFSQMDLVCCRNLLIYLEPVLQNKVISLFHYALRPGGYLVLGPSEGVGNASNLFTSEDRTHKIFSRKMTGARQVVSFSLNRQPERGPLDLPRSARRLPDSTWNYMEAQKEFDRRLISQYVPAAAFVNDDLEVIHSRGNISRYLKLPAGRASLSALKMAREGLFLELRNAIVRARKEGNPVRRQGIRMKLGNGGRDKFHAEATGLVNFEVTPIGVGKPAIDYFMLVFEDAHAIPAPGKASRRTLSQKEMEASDAARATKLEQELAATKEYLQSVIETHESTNEELQSANEEILSSNEELQSTNEELETAKEELQSANEELSTVNDELRNRNLEVNQINSDLTALLSSIDMAVIMVGKDLSIRRFTPRAKEFLGLIAGDIGRPLLNINLLIDLPEFHSLVMQVIADSRPLEKPITGPDRISFMLRILPYLTSEGKSEGAVITFANLNPK